MVNNLVTKKLSKIEISNHCKCNIINVFGKNVTDVINIRDKKLKFNKMVIC